MLNKLCTKNDVLNTSLHHDQFVASIQCKVKPGQTQ
jgi:hypothetical protein